MDSFFASPRIQVVHEDLDEDPRDPRPAAEGSAEGSAERCRAPKAFGRNGEFMAISPRKMVDLTNLTGY